MGELKAWINKIVERIDELQPKIDQIGQELVEKYTKIRADRWEDAVHKSADEFYAGYSPRKYRRTNALHSIHHIDADPGSGRLSIEFSGLLPGHQSEALIYELVFKQGYHGGSYGKADPAGVSASTPCYRTPSGKWTYWADPAGQSPAPYDRMIERFKQIDHEIQEVGNAELNMRIAKLFMSIV